MALNINQFSQTTVQGQMDLQFQGSVISAQVDAAQAASLIAGQAVKIATTSGGVPKMLALAGDSDPTFGFVSRNLKDAADPTYSSIEVAMDNSVMYMTASGAITRGGSVEVVSASTKVAAWAGVNPVVGFALDTALADGDLIRVYIKTPIISSSSVRYATVSATLAEINAGKILLPGVVGKAINVLDYTARVTGAFASGTSVALQSTNGTPVVVTTIAEAGLTNGAILKPSSANTVLGAGFSTPLGSGDGLKVVNNGSAQTGGTSISFTIAYQQN